MRLVLTCLLFALSAPAAVAQWPTRPVKVIVPYPAGGVVDVMTRAVTIRLATDLGQPFVVEAKPGAGANIAAEFVANAPADGYTLLVSAPYLINNPLLESGLRWQPKQFAPVARYALSPSFMLVPANSPAKTVKDYIAMAKAKPKLPIGDGGTGSTQSMATKMLAAVAGVTFESIGYKGAPPVIPDLVNGALTMSIIPSTVAIPQVTSGKLRALANTSDKRSPLLPDVPTIAEAGFPEVTVLSWYAFHVPTGTPAEAIDRLSAAVGAATATAEVQGRLANAGGEAAFLGRADFVNFLRSDTERWERFAKAFQK
ncbi:MAG: tripartite tricarboxylate transporter substrate binding protein [Burkholderiales bacterium]|nr:tripartite tricarboxylate transporter substrate binding protein [Burkholderiales bacterium]